MFNSFWSSSRQPHCLRYLHKMIYFSKTPDFFIIVVHVVLKSKTVLKQLKTTHVHNEHYVTVGEHYRTVRYMCMLKLFIILPTVFSLLKSIVPPC